MNQISKHIYSSAIFATLLSFVPYSFSAASATKSELFTCENALNFDTTKTLKATYEAMLKEFKVAEKGNEFQSILKQQKIDDMTLIRLVNRTREYVEAATREGSASDFQIAKRKVTLLNLICQIGGCSQAQARSMQSFVGVSLNRAFRKMQTAIEARDGQKLEGIEFPIEEKGSPLGYPLANLLAERGIQLRPGEWIRFDKDVNLEELQLRGSYFVYSSEEAKKYEDAPWVRKGILSYRWVHPLRKGEVVSGSGDTVGIILGGYLSRLDGSTNFSVPAQYQARTNDSPSDIKLLPAPKGKQVDDFDRDRMEHILSTNEFMVGRSLKQSDTFFSGLMLPELEALTPDSVWMDMGAGEANVQLDALDQQIVKVKEAIAISLVRPESKRIDGGLRVHPQFSYQAGWKVESPEFAQATSKWLGTVDLITDQMGPFSYSEDIEAVLKRYFELLKVGGTLVVNIQLRFGSAQHSFAKNYFRSSKLQGLGSYQGVTDFFKQIKGIEVVTEKAETHTDGSRHEKVLTLVIKKTNDAVEVPEVFLTGFGTGHMPPHRDFEF